ncbi:MAG TPA: VacJ family lipoprotein [Candidatus Acidoferrales bacterium]|nr:VacJ family lipoprotein [Candidatus Acidoferrales bacterium]
MYQPCKLTFAVGVLLALLVGIVGPRRAVAGDDLLVVGAEGAEADENVLSGAFGSRVTYASAVSEASAGEEGSAVDPWEPFNEKMFAFNRQVDRFVLKPVATAWNFVLPDVARRCLANAFDNIDVVRRLTNSLLQLKFAGAGREVSRFVINSTVGVAGLFDVAKNQLGIEPSEEDTGQTFGVYGVGPGPYLVLPFLPVMTVRDGLGMVADTAMNPLIWVVPVGATLGMRTTDVVNDRSLNLDRFERVEESVIDLYGAVRSAYLERRAAAIRE